MKRSVLFICSANSARSQMAEALLRHHAGAHFEVFSAGTEPEPIDPRTLSALEDYGVPSTGLFSKSLSSLSDQRFDYVISLCDKAHDECRQWPGAGVVMAWDFPDPRISSDPRAFVHTLQEISERIRLFILVNSKDVSTQTKPLTALEFFKALSDETRLLALLLIEQEGELCVCELMAALAESQPKISRHLAQLRKSGLLLDRRQGQWVYYRLHPLLHDWMVHALAHACAHEPALLQPALVRLHTMPDRPQACVAKTNLPLDIEEQA